MHAVNIPALPYPSKPDDTLPIDYKGSIYILDTKIVKRPENICKLIITSIKQSSSGKIMCLKKPNVYYEQLKI